MSIILCNFALKTVKTTEMYSLREAWRLCHGEEPMDGWDGKIACVEEDARWAMESNTTQGSVAIYSFTIVVRGCLTFIYNGREMTMHPNDVFIYSPGMPITLVEVSTDYNAYCLMADEDTTLRVPSARDLVSLAYVPIVQLHEPKLTLSKDVANSLVRKMQEIILSSHTDHIYKAEILRMLYAAFLLDLQGAQEQAIHEHSVPQRMEELFIGFMRLLPRHFAEHHDIGFYADCLSITPDYLSRIVRRITGRTVIDYINQHLLMEASYLLSTTSLSIAQIADRLHFADTPSFSKFFSHKKGVTPKDYRKKFMRQ